MMRPIGLAALACLIVVPARGESPLQGQWQVTFPNSPDYVGIVRVDPDGRATWNSPLDNGKPANYRGYVAKADGFTAEIVLTDGTQVAKTYCAVQSSELLHCRTIRGDESPSKPYALVRITREMPKLWSGPR